MTLIVYLINCLYKKELIDPLLFLNWYFFSSKMRVLWIIFFSFVIGLLTSALATLDLNYSSILTLFSLILFFIVTLTNFIKAIFSDHPTVITKTILKEVPTFPSLLLNPCEIIYIMRRKDGILKFGRTKDLPTRLRFHREDYQSEFQVIASWVVFQSEEYERLALTLTKKFAYTENGRRELRKMSDDELSNFIFEFSIKVQKGFLSATR